jgi:parvulin-like peptidyl-prolyl isomerase
LAKKKKAEKPKREVTKRQLSHWQRQKRRQRIIFGSGILIVVAVLAVVGAGVYFGWYVPEQKPLNETVIKVNETEFDMDYYVKMLKYYGGGMGMQNMEFVADWVVTNIQSNELIKQEALKLGIIVSDEEVDQELNSRDPPLSKDYRDAVRAGMLVDRLRHEYFDQQVPPSAEQRHIWAMFLESQSQANEIRDRLEGGELFSELAAEFCLDSFCKEKEGDLGWRARGVLPLLMGSEVLEESAFNCEERVLSEPVYEETKFKMVGYWLIRVEFVDEEAEIVQVKAMLLSSEEEANEVRSRLEAGEDFATLAEEFSQHDESKENGGELEVSKGEMGSAFDEFAFDPEVELESLSQPIRDDTFSTQGGYWLLKVTGIDENRYIEEEDRDLLKNDALSKWIEALRDNPDNVVEDYLDEDKKAWAIMHALEG